MGYTSFLRWLQVHINKKQAPAFSFGIRHSEYMAPFVPESAK